MNALKVDNKGDYLIKKSEFDSLDLQTKIRITVQVLLMIHKIHDAAPSEVVNGKGVFSKLITFFKDNFHQTKGGLKDNIYSQHRATFYQETEDLLSLHRKLYPLAEKGQLLRLTICRIPFINGRPATKKEVADAFKTSNSTAGNGKSHPENAIEHIEYVPRYNDSKGTLENHPGDMKIWVTLETQKRIARYWPINKKEKTLCREPKEWPNSKPGYQGRLYKNHVHRLRKYGRP